MKKIVPQVLCFTACCFGLQAKINRIIETAITESDYNRLKKMIKGKAFSFNEKNAYRSLAQGIVFLRLTNFNTNKLMAEDVLKIDNGWEILLGIAGLAGVCASFQLFNSGFQRELNLKKLVSLGIGLPSVYFLGKFLISCLVRDQRINMYLKDRYNKALRIKNSINDLSIS